jgi:molybdopterin-containing oxidoreductase family membrane subunit
MATVALPTKKPSLITPGFLAWLAFLGLCIVIGLVSAYEVLTKGLSVTNMSNTVPWGLWITIDLSAIALGAGAFTLSAIVYLLRLKRFEPIVRLAVYVGFVGYTTALLTLVMDIGRPDRFWHPWAYWNVHSVLWEITWCITLYLVILAAEFLPVMADLPFFARWAWFRKLAHGIHKIAPVLAVIGMGISLLHQSSLGATYGILRSRPIWFKPSMPIMFILSAVAVGPALTMAIAHITEWAAKRSTVPHDVLRAIARFSGFGLLAYLYIKVWDLMAVTYYGRSPQVNQGFAILNEQTPYGFGFFVVEIGLGIIIPAIFFLSSRFNRQPVYLVVGALCAMLGIIANRWNVTVSGLTVPLSYSPGVLYQSSAGVYSPSLAEWGVAIGVIGYALLMLTIGLRFLPLFNGHHSEPSKS